MATLAELEAQYAELDELLSHVIEGQDARLDDDGGGSVDGELSEDVRAPRGLHGRG